VKPEPLQALLERMCAGDLQAAEQALLAHETQLRVIVRRQLSRRLRAKFDSVDVVQSVWVRVLQDFQKKGCRIESTDHLRNFLVRVTRNCLIDRLRYFRTALEREQPLTEGVPLPASGAGQPRPSEIAQANELWDTLLENCPPEYHELLRLKQQGLPLARIAASTGLHEDSVRRIIRRLARKVAFTGDPLTS
jgi:RNA polymerase sigma factor (sigma-70 family)